MRDGSDVIANPANAIVDEFRTKLHERPDKPVFGDMLAALIRETGTSYKKLGGVLQNDGRTYSRGNFGNVVSYISQPSYWLVHDIIAKNPFGFDQGSIAHEESPLRVFFYRAANLFEVTESTRRTFQQDVVNSTATYFAHHAMQTASAQALFRKFVEFECQGERMELKEIHADMQNAPSGGMNLERFRHWIAGDIHCNDKEERKAFYLAIHMEPAVWEVIENLISSKRLTTDIEVRSGRISGALDDILLRLKEKGVTTPLIEAQSREQATNTHGKGYALLRGVSVGSSELSKYRRGNDTPSVAKMRAIVLTLEHYEKNLGFISKDDIDRLLKTYGTNREKLMDCSEAFISRIQSDTSIKTLLRDIASAVDVCAEDKVIMITVPTPPVGGGVAAAKLTQTLLCWWTSEKLKYELPTPEQAEALMQRYNTIRVAHGHPSYTQAQIDAVKAVAARDYTKIAGLTVRERAPEPRELITPRIVIEGGRGKSGVDLAP